MKIGSYNAQTHTRDLPIRRTALSPNPDRNSLREFFLPESHGSSFPNFHRCHSALDRSRVYFTSRADYTKDGETYYLCGINGNDPSGFRVFDPSQCNLVFNQINIEQHSRLINPQEMIKALDHLMNSLDPRMAYFQEDREFIVVNLTEDYLFYLERLGEKEKLEEAKILIDAWKAKYSSIH